MDQATLESCKSCTPNNVNPGVWDHAQFETNRISDLSGWHMWQIKEAEDYLLPRFTRTPSEPGIGLNPRKHLRFSFSADSDVTFWDPVGHRGDPADGQVSKDGTYRDMQGDSQDVTFLGLKRGALACDPPRSRMRMGVEHYRESRGAHLWDTDCVCMWDLYRTAPGTVEAYFLGARQAFPLEVQVALSREMLRWVIAQGKNNSSEPNAPGQRGEISLNAGNIPYAPLNVLHWSTLDHHASVMMGNRWSGKPEYCGSTSTLYYLLLSYQLGVVQSSLEANQFNAFNVPAGQTYEFPNFTYRVKSVPWIGYIDSDNDNVIRLLSPRKLTAGNAGGMVQEYDPKYCISPVYEKNGKTYQKVELIEFMDKGAAEVSSMALPKMDWSNVNDQVPPAFDVSVDLVGGAYIPNNEQNRKFFLLAETEFERSPVFPERMGVVAAQFRPIATNVPLDLPAWTDTSPAEDPISIAAAPLPKANRAIDAENGVDPDLELDLSGGDLCGAGQVQVIDPDADTAAEIAAETFVFVVSADAEDGGPLYTGGYTGSWYADTIAQVESFTCVADVSDSLDGTYFLLNDDAGSVAFWFDVDDSGTTIPAGASAADRAIEITTIVTDDDASTVATKVAAAIDADGKFGAAAVGSKVTVTHTPAGARTDATAGDSGFTSFTVVTDGFTGYTNGERYYTVAAGYSATPNGTAVFTSSADATGGAANITEVATSTVVGTSALA